MINILVVDDEVIERDCIRHLLGNFEDVRILEAKNGVEALETAKKEKPHIVITDIKMPFMDGIELAKNLNELDSAIKILIISAFGEFEYARQAIKYGANGFILKPLNIDEFLNIVEKMLTEIKLTEEGKDKTEIDFFDTDMVNDNGDIADTSIEDIIDEINHAVINSNAKGIKTGMDKCFSHLQKTSGLSSLYVRHLCLEIIRNAISSLNIKNEDRVIDVANQIRQIRNFASLNEYVVNVLIDITDEYNLGTNVYSRKLINTIIDIIQSEYTQDISLEYLAEKVYLSPSYISSLFKKETGENIIKYLTNYRLEKAKELLDNTNMKISEVRKQTGFSNDSYFITLFKKYTGKTPAQYKEGN